MGDVARGSNRRPNPDRAVDAIRATLDALIARDLPGARAALRRALASLPERRVYRRRARLVNRAQ